MKVGDLVWYQYDSGASTFFPASGTMGTVIDFPAALHAKEFQKVKVFTENGIEVWIMQFCEIVNEA